MISSNLRQVVRSAAEDFDVAAVWLFASAVEDDGWQRQGLPGAPGWFASAQDHRQAALAAATHRIPAAPFSFPGPFSRCIVWSRTLG